MRRNRTRWQWREWENGLGERWTSEYQLVVLPRNFGAEIDRNDSRPETGGPDGCYSVWFYYCSDDPESDREAVYPDFCPYGRLHWLTKPTVELLLKKAHAWALVEPINVIDLPEGFVPNAA